MLAKYRRTEKNTIGMTEEEKGLELTKQWLDSCRHIDEEIDHERAVLLYHLMRIKQLDALSLVIEKVSEEIEKGESFI